MLPFISNYFDAEFFTIYRLPVVTLHRFVPVIGWSEDP